MPQYRSENWVGDEIKKLRIEHHLHHTFQTEIS